MIQEETQRLLQVLRVAMRILDVNNRDIERAIGLSYDYMRRLFSGSIEPKVEPAFRILGVRGLPPAESCRLAYPRKPAPPRQAATRMRSIRDGFGAIPREERPAARDL